VKSIAHWVSSSLLLQVFWTPLQRYQQINLCGANLAGTDQAIINARLSRYGNKIQSDCQPKAQFLNDVK
jgi:glucose-6-phosphate dehydrogenase assembly protein OpcA